MMIKGHTAHSKTAVHAMWTNRPLPQSFCTLPGVTSIMLTAHNGMHHVYVTRPHSEGVRTAVLTANDVNSHQDNQETKTWQSKD